MSRELDPVPDMGGVVIMRSFSGGGKGDDGLEGPGPDSSARRTNTKDPSVAHLGIRETDDRNSWPLCRT
jgi:hypothetical protein